MPKERKFMDKNKYFHLTVRILFTSGTSDAQTSMYTELGFELIPPLPSNELAVILLLVKRVARHITITRHMIGVRIGFGRSAGIEKLVWTSVRSGQSRTNNKTCDSVLKTDDVDCSCAWNCLIDFGNITKDFHLKNFQGYTTWNNCFTPLSELRRGKFRCLFLSFKRNVALLGTLQLSVENIN